MSSLDFIHKSSESTDATTPKLISEEPGLIGVNQEFNQYVEYYMHLISMKSKGHLLIVEDDLFCRKVVERAIREYSQDITIYSAESEYEALKILATCSCDIVISDYYLEGPVTGLELCRKIVSLYPKTKCVMMSNMGFYKYREVASSSLGPMVPPEFMEKPVSASLIKKYLTSFFEDFRG
jgi:DNA-binding NtrC family response regulator